MSCTPGTQRRLARRSQALGGNPAVDDIMARHSEARFEASPARTALHHIRARHGVARWHAGPATASTNPLTTKVSPATLTPSRTEPE